MKFKTLKDLCTDIIDCPHTTPNWKMSGIPVVRNYNLKNGFIDTSNLSYVDEETFKKRIKRGTPEENDLVFSREAPVGSVGIIPSNFKCCLGQRLVLLKVNQDLCDPHYLLYVMLSNFVKKQYITVEKTGSIVSNFNIGDLRDLVIPYVNMELQKKISGICRSIDYKVNNNNRLISTLESLSKTLYDYYFLQFDFPDEKGRPYKSSGGKMEYNAELGREIPAGWKVTPVSDLVDCNANTATAKAMEYPVNYLDTSNITQNIIDTIQVISTPAQLPSRARRIIKNNDIVISTVRPNLKHYGFIKCLNRKVILSTGYAVLSPKNQAYSSYIYQAVTSDEIQKTIDQIAQLNVSAYPSFNPSDLLNLKIAIPNCDDILYNFSGKLDKSYETISHKQQENRHLTALRDFLLPLLMNGQVGFKK